ncbi:Protein of unknown function [Pyronema omphalodes CBS 100304]|uniref:Uncharacterized protein n=1 Tax=Pyronema omphalodes (strain CBS 100304) TaxID=1076935 RepID=U4LW93_PYROM|nr:Protein of unknown function [Pyronema omphalodes CBS 100304]
MLNNDKQSITRDGPTRNPAELRTQHRRLDAIRNGPNGHLPAACISGEKSYLSYIWSTVPGTVYGCYIVLPLESEDLDGTLKILRNIIKRRLRGVQLDVNRLIVSGTSSAAFGQTLKHGQTLASEDRAYKACKL